MEGWRRRAVGRAATGGSGEVRFYLRRAAGGWRVIEGRSAHGVGSPVPCADHRVPAEIRCGVAGRS